MGNKRKAVAIILGVVVFAVGIVSGALLAFKPNRLNDAPVANAATATVSNGSEAKVEGGSVGCNTSVSFAVTSGRVYYAELAGQAGTDAGNTCGGGNSGKGAVCYGLFRANSSTVYGVIGGGSNSQSRNRGGGYTKLSVSMNIATPNTTKARSDLSAGAVYAGGGGGSSDDGFVGGTGTYGTAATTCDRYRTGYNATQDAVGAHGAGDSHQVGNDGSGHNGGASAHVQNGGGGGGYYGGGGGTKNSGGGNCGAGGAGSSSPSLYGKYCYEHDKDKAHAGFGYIRLVDMTPRQVPTSAKVTMGNTATFTVSTGNDPFPSPIYRMFQYSVDGGNSWGNTIPSRTTVGVTTVKWRYIVTPSSSSSAAASAEYQDFPALHMPAINVLESGEVTLEVTKYTGTVSAPTLTGNGSATYNGNNIQVVTAAGQSSGTFTFATVKTKDEE